MFVLNVPHVARVEAALPEAEAVPHRKAAIVLPVKYPIQEHRVTEGMDLSTTHFSR